MQHDSSRIQGHPLEGLVPPDLLFSFRRPNINRKLNDNLSVEIENLQEAPGFSYIRFYDENGRVFIPPDLMCIDLTASALAEPLKDTSDQSAFILTEASWHAFCTKETVLAYIHTAGSICLPTEVIPYPELTDMSLLTNENSVAFELQGGDDGVWYMNYC
jgi:hypothetical protein